MKCLVTVLLLLFVLTACNQSGKSKTENNEPSAITPAETSEIKKVLPPAPDSNVKITEEYAKLVARDAYFWAWPMMNMYNRRVLFSQVKELLYAGPLPQAPLNQFCMLTDYVDPLERGVACPNQDVVYGAGGLALDLSPVVIQVPDFGDRFWVYQVVDTRTDGFAQLGKMHDTKPGFYLLAGPRWKGEVPKGITKVFHSSTNSGMVAPRVFMDDTKEDREAIQPVLKQIAMYPLEQFDGKMKTIEWSKLPKMPGPPSGDEEVTWVIPEKFFDELPAVLADAPPMAGEEAAYAQILAVIAAAKKDPKIKTAITEVAKETEVNVVKPLFQFRNFGKQLPYNWSTITNGADFGTDHFIRTAVAKSNILVNLQQQAKYFYQDLDEKGERLNSVHKYTITFAKDQTPPVNGFWSLTLYNQYHFFEINKLNRYSLGTKNKSLKHNADGSLTFYVQADPPADEFQNNWLPAPKNGDFSLFMRAYWPKEEITKGAWTPPAVIKVK